MFPATSLWTSNKTKVLGTHRKFELDFFFFVCLFRLISSNLQLLQNFSVSCICDILYDILLCLRRKEEWFSWEILDAIGSGVLIQMMFLLSQPKEMYVTVIEKNHEIYYYLLKVPFYVN